MKNNLYLDEFLMIVEEYNRLHNPEDSREGVYADEM